MARAAGGLLDGTPLSSRLRGDMAGTAEEGKTRPLRTDPDMLQVIEGNLFSAQAVVEVSHAETQVIPLAKSCQGMQHGGRIRTAGNSGQQVEAALPLQQPSQHVVKCSQHGWFAFRPSAGAGCPQPRTSMRSRPPM